MSWAAHDPEGWSGVCIKGILAKLDENRGLTQPDREIDREVLEDLESFLRSYNIFLALCDWAGDEISGFEADYFASKGEQETP